MTRSGPLVGNALSLSDEQCQVFGWVTRAETLMAKTQSFCMCTWQVQLSLRWRVMGIDGIGPGLILSSRSCCVDEN